MCRFREGLGCRDVVVALVLVVLVVLGSQQ